MATALLQARQFAELQQQVFGIEHEVDLSSTDSADPLELLKLAAAAPRSDLSFKARMATLTALPAALADEAAANGFALKTGPGELQCVVCGATVQVDRELISGYEEAGAVSDEDVVDGPARFRHRLGCQYRRLLTVCLSGGGRRSPGLSSKSLSVVDHLRREMATSKAKVAREFSFEEDAICTAMGVRYLTTGGSYPDAGSLVDDLTDLIVERGGAERPLSVISGLAGLVTATESARRHSSDDALPGSATGPPVAKRRSSSTVQAPPARSSQSLLTETLSLYASTLCRACRSRTAQFLALPCAHISLCGDCATSASHCPACRHSVSQLVKTFGG